MQPIKKNKNFKENFSNELNGLIEYIKKEVSENYSFSKISIPVFILAGLENSDTMLFKSLNGFLTKFKIDEIHNAVSEIVQNLSPVGMRYDTGYAFDPDLNGLFSLANDERAALNHELITSDHVLLAFLASANNKDDIKRLFINEGVTYDFYRELSSKLHDTTSIISKMDDSQMESLGAFISSAFSTAIDMGAGDDHTAVYIVGPSDMQASTKKQSKNTIQSCINLNEQVKKNNFDCLIGRDEEIDKIAKVFARKKCNNVLLIGESGVGKTAIVEGLAKRIVEDIAPSSIRDYTIQSLSLSEIMTGTQYRGSLEDKVANIIRDIKNAKNIILFIDDAHNLFNDSRKNDYDFASAFSEIFTDSNVKVILATTPKGYHNTFEGNNSLIRKFQKITIESPSEKENVEIINGLLPYYEEYHGVKYCDNAANIVIKLAKRYITDKNLPSSAIDILDIAGASKKVENTDTKALRDRRIAINEFSKDRDKAVREDNMQKALEAKHMMEGLKLEIAEINDSLGSLIKENKNNTVTQEDIYNVVSEMTGIPIQKINVSEKKTLLNIEDVLKKGIVGQDEAINVVAQAIKRNKIGLYQKNKPIFSCMCIGNSGTGKTLLAKEIAKELFGDEKYLIRFDMSEYSDKTAVNKLIGSSAGYVGYNEGGLLTEKVKNNKYAVVLIDEVEKADDQVYNLFLQILDEGVLTDNTGQKVDFKNTILIMTSNVGAKRANQEKGIGFSVDENSNKKSIIEKELKKKFPPEFINRLDEMVYFNDLTEENLKKIIGIEINKFNERLNENLNVDIEYKGDIIGYIYSIIKGEKEYGARPILRTIQRELENRVTDLILEEDEIKSITIEVNKGTLTAKATN